MSLNIGIVGLQSVGKTTLFNALTRNQVPAAKFVGAKAEANVGAAPLPDPRLEVLAELFSAQKIIPATVNFVDIAGLTAGDAGANRILADVRETDAICVVLRAFNNPNVMRAEGSTDAAGDLETIVTELVIADMDTLERQLTRIEKEVRIKKGDPALLAAGQKAMAILEEGLPVSAGAAAAGITLADVASFHLLTAKPFIYVFNADDALLADAAARAELAKLVAPSEAIFLDAQFEADLVELEPDEAEEMRAEAGVTESGLDQLARVGFETLGLQTYLTAGPKEARAWTIRKGAKAPEAAGVIHTDFQRGFIKAEVVAFDDMVEYKTFPAARAAGKARMEGKEYVMKNGDVVEFRFNV